MKLQYKVASYMLFLFGLCMSKSPQYILNLNNSEILDSVYDSNHFAYLSIEKFIEQIEHPIVLRNINENQTCVIVDSAKVKLLQDVGKLIDSISRDSKNDFGSCLCKCAYDTIIDNNSSTLYVIYCDEVKVISKTEGAKLLVFGPEQSDIVNHYRHNILFNYKHHDYSARDYENYKPIKTPLFRVRCFNDLNEYSCESDTIASIIEGKLRINDNDPNKRIKILEFAMAKDESIKLIANQFGESYFVKIKQIVRNRKHEVETNGFRYRLSGIFDRSNCALKINRYRIELISIE